MRPCTGQPTPWHGRAAVLLVALAAGLTAPAARATEPPETAVRAAPAGSAIAYAPDGAPAHTPAPPLPQCFTAVHGSTAVADCQNPDPDTAHVALHIACRRWWDPATDTVPAAVGPAQTVTLTGRCWKEIRAVWTTVR
ncbi:hypothetical protein K7472_22055 [Streptomyces sp. PTM05]|uniref:Secreted protein n=1 Tax=Streptantibioticus parmotrematis TaxID=2873249 RepID=A0ABS7QWB0_9ACTN|nr:hypothetical protein [Streptantibioticus parmotrematis]MBY8887503.1 hypothetical protein [Streptantibioticus parmotrematis]